MATLRRTQAGPVHTRRSFLRTSLAAASASLAGATRGIAIKEQSTVVLPGARETDGVLFLSPDDRGFAEARQVYNASILAKPNVIACCGSEPGVQRALEVAANERWPVAVKAGGHSFEGFSLNDDGLVVNVSPMREMLLDPQTGVLTAGSGCRLAEVNQFLLAHGRFLPAGSCATVGLAGLTLGGGYGMFARKWGLTCDHLRSLRMVDGTGIVRDSVNEPDLLWAARGGGNGHFGVVTQLTFQTRPAPTGFSSWKFRMYKLNAERAAALLQAWFEGTRTLPNDAFSAWVMNGSQVTILVTTIGSKEQKGLAAFCGAMAKLSNKTTTAGPTALTKALKWYYAEPGPIYFKNACAGYYKGMDEVRSALPGIFGEVLSTPGIIFQVNTLGGAIGDGPEGAYPHREYNYLGEQQAYWQTSAQAATRIAAIRRMQEYLSKAGINRHYANYPDLAFNNWPTAYYGAKNYARLQKLKQRFDPDNRIRHPQSVRPPE